MNTVYYCIRDFNIWNWPTLRMYTTGTVDPFHLHLPGKSSSKAGDAGSTKGFTDGMKLKAGYIGRVT